MKNKQTKEYPNTNKLLAMMETPEGEEPYNPMVQALQSYNFIGAKKRVNNDPEYHGNFESNTGETPSYQPISKAKKSAGLLNFIKHNVYQLIP